MTGWNFPTILKMYLLLKKWWFFTVFGSDLHIHRSLQENVTAALKFDSAFLGTEPPKVHHLRMVSTHRCHGDGNDVPWDGTGWFFGISGPLMVGWNWKQWLNCRGSFDASWFSFLCGMLLKCWWVWGSLTLGIGRMLDKYLTCGRMGPTTEAPKQILSRSR